MKEKQTSTNKMTHHQRYKAFMRFKPVDRPVLQEWPAWKETMFRWMRESQQNSEQVLSYQKQCDPETRAHVDFSMIPPFEELVLKEDDNTITKTDKMGMTYRIFKDNPELSMPEFIDSPVKSPADWKDIKKRFDPNLAERYPADWEQQVKIWEKEEPILRLYGLVANYYGGPSLFGFVRMLLGEEQVHYAFYDEPKMVEDMMETATDFALAVLSKALKEAPITVCQFWEDMCYKQGSLLSPDMFRKFMIPRYKRITCMMRDAGVDIIFVDSDGNVEELIPLWLEAGINGIFPMEQAAGNDIYAYRKRYGKNLLMTGGIDKRVLAQDKAAIDRELQEKIPLAFEGGYIPTIDHSIPPDVPYENFLYYFQKKKEMLGV